MLRERNGFYALESALHVFPSHSSQQEIGLDKWNESALWRAEYKGVADGCLFFAEDVFGGGQFCVKDGKSTMKFRASIANQIKDLPDGAQIKFNVIR